MVPAQTYKKFFTELVRRHMVIFGANIARDIASQTTGLKVDSTGEVTDISGSPVAILQMLVSQYQELSEPVALLQLRLLLNEYKDIYLEYNQPIPAVKLICALTETRP
jgi:tetrahydromethanopterin S-methyltransferase subunit C